MLSGVSNNQAYSYSYSESQRENESESGAAKADDQSGGPITGMINRANAILDQPALKSVGDALSKMGPVGKLIHVIPDFFIGELLSKAGEKFANALGDHGKVETHFEREKREGEY